VTAAKREIDDIRREIAARRPAGGVLARTA
jgi:hypothetical protein